MSPSVDREQLIASVVREVLSRMQTAPPQAAAPTPAPPVSEDGVFETVDAAVEAAGVAQAKVAAMSLDDRGRMTTIIRRVCRERAHQFARMELDETHLGRLDHKIEKLLAVERVLGVEYMRTEARSDVSGLALIEHAPFGVIGMVLPATHPIPTMAGNAINVLASGNTAVFSPHPLGAKAAAYALKIFNHEIRKELGVENVLTTIREPGIQSAGDIFQHPGIHLLCVTGGPALVKAASKAGKRVIAAGPGNPPVVVDETADLALAASCIVRGASFDNNLLCIAEKEVFVVASVADSFLAAMRAASAYQLDAAALERLTKAAFHFDAKDGAGCARAHVNRDLIGKDISVLAAAAGISVPAGTQLLFVETAADHPFVVEEQMMPFVPVVRVSNFEAGLAEAIKAEHGYRHTAMIHSRDMLHVSQMARAMNTTLFLHNAPCMASLGLGGPSYLSYSIATPTGEGVTTPLTFTRQRQIMSSSGMRIL